MTNIDHIETYRDAAGGWRYRAVGANGEVLFQGESHTRQGDVIRAARESFPDASIVQQDMPTAPEDDAA